MNKAEDSELIHYLSSFIWFMSAIYWLPTPLTAEHCHDTGAQLAMELQLSERFRFTCKNKPKMIIKQECAENEKKKKIAGIFFLLLLSYRFGNWWVKKKKKTNEIYSFYHRFENRWEFCAAMLMAI